jgi:uncharacterized lipoprotein YajG
MKLKPITAIAVLLLLVASLLISGCTTSRNEQTVQVSATNTPSGKTTVSVTATHLDSMNSYNTKHGGPLITATPSYKFVKYAVYVQNINAKDMQLGNPNFIKLRDTAGNIYSYDSIATYNLDTQQVNGTKLDGLMDELNTQPGDKLSGFIVFQIPTSATPKSLTYDDYTNNIVINL